MKVSSMQSPLCYPSLYSYTPAWDFSPEDSQLAARSTRSAIHGFLALEHFTGTLFGR